MTADAVGGVWTYALELVRALAVHGVEIDLALMGPPPGRAQRDEAGLLSNLTLHESGYALEWMDDPWQDVDLAGEWLLALAETTKPAVIHLNGCAHAALPWDRPVLVVAHSCVCSWWQGVQAETAPSRYDEYRRRVGAGLAAADVVVAPTAAMLDDLQRHYGVEIRGRVIHNAREPDQFSCATKAPKIFAAGRAWDPAKNLALLDAIAPQVHWPIYLAGDCQHPGGDWAQFANVHCLGKLDAAAMTARFAESAIYVLPARYEPFGLSALEAGLCGCALVLGDIPSLREVWGDAAFFVEPNDGQALTTALNDLIENDASRLDLGRRALKQALDYSPSKMTRRYLAAYHDCLEPSLSEVAA